MTFHLVVLIQSKISAKFPSEECFRESALWLGNASLLPFFVCWVTRNMLEKPQGKDELNLCWCFFSQLQTPLQDQDEHKKCH